MLQYLVKPKQVTDSALTNYLDDFLFMALRRMICDLMLRTFLEMCKRIEVPVAYDKTEWSTVLIVFLGILLDGRNHVLAIPDEKKVKAVHLL